MFIKKHWLVSFMAAANILCSSCDDNDLDPSSSSTGTFQLKFETITAVTSTETLDKKDDHDNEGGHDHNEHSHGRILDDDVYPYSTKAGQAYDITALQYFITSVSLRGDEEIVFEETVAVSASEATGIYLIDGKTNRLTAIDVSQIPFGTYNELSFKVGIDSGIVAQGSAGGVLDQASAGPGSDMFWSWNSGYVGMKLEGKAADSQGGAVGGSIASNDPHGFSFHIGGWSSAQNNVKEITIPIDPITVAEGIRPEVHILFRLEEILSGVDFGAASNIHSPKAGAPIANNFSSAFVFDHVHQ